jgi:hypothetical protein
MPPRAASTKQTSLSTDLGYFTDNAPKFAEQITDLYLLSLKESQKTTSQNEFEWKLPSTPKITHRSYHTFTIFPASTRKPYEVSSHKSM